MSTHISALLPHVDVEIAQLIEQESERQHAKLEMIASENFVPRALLEAAGTVLTNKYAEGYPGKRYYGGCEIVDQIEEIARQRACALFQADHANVQPHSGSNANMAVYLALLKPGGKIFSMDLAHGGHLTHGASVSFSGKLYEVHSYGVSRDTECLDYDELERRAQEVRPDIIVCGYSAYPRAIDFARFRRIADASGAHLMADISHIAGLVIAGQHASPLPYADIVTTTTHKTLRGPRGGLILIGKDGENRLGITAPATKTKPARLRRYSELIDSAVMPGVQGGPLMHIIAAKAAAFHLASTEPFLQYQRQIVANAQILAKTLQAGGARLVSGGTDTHLVLVDLQPFQTTGRDAEQWLDRAHITVNKNGIPYDPRSPFVTSGIRIGVPAITTRGMKEAEIEKIGNWILEVLRSDGDAHKIENVAQKVQNLTKDFPLVAKDWEA